MKRITATTPRLTLDTDRDDYCFECVEWVCGGALRKLITRHARNFKPILYADHIWLTVSNRPLADGVECTLVVEHIDNHHNGPNYLLAIHTAKETGIWDMLGHFITDSLNLHDGGTCYRSLDYDDGKGGE